jgi:UDP-glucose 4-epimerase
MSLTVLTTGGAGFIGSHTVLELLNIGHSVIAVDNCCNAYQDKNEALPESLKRVEEITGKKIIFYNVDIRDKNALDLVFKKVIYFIIT